MPRINVDKDKLIKIINTVHDRCECVPHDYLGYDCKGVVCEDCPYFKKEERLSKALEMMEVGMSYYEGYTKERYIEMMKTRMRDLAHEIIDEIDAGELYDVSVLVKTIMYYYRKILDKECEEESNGKEI